MKTSFSFKEESYFYKLSKGIEENELDERYKAAKYSLRIALMAYFSSYNKVKSIIDDYYLQSEDEINELIESSEDYIESVIQIWIQLQRFFELEMKRLLENKNINLSLKVKNSDKLYCDIFLGLPYNDLVHTTNSVEFGEAFNRLKYFVEENSITEEEAKILVDNKDCLDTINNMRNMLSHRGLRIIKYCKMDELFCKDILPFLNRYLECEDIKKHYNKLFENEKEVTALIAPLIKAGEKIELDYSEIAYYKEIARSKINDKGGFGKVVWDRIRANKIKYGTINLVQLSDNNCPCCGQAGLVGAEEWNQIDEDNNYHELCSLDCLNCGLSINRFIYKFMSGNDEKDKLSIKYEA